MSLISKRVWGAACIVAVLGTIFTALAIKYGVVQIIVGFVVAAILTAMLAIGIFLLTTDK